MKKECALLVFLVSVVVWPHSADAAETVQKYGYDPESFEIKYYAQPRYQAELNGDSEVTNSFLVRRARIYLTSKISPTLTGRVQVNALPDKVVMLEGYFHWTPFISTRDYAVRVGMLKKPFGYQEYVLSSSKLNLIDRTTTNAFLEKDLHATAEDIGGAVYADFRNYDVPVTVHAGVFNGEAKGKKSDTNSGKQFVMRAEGVPVGGLTLGANGALVRVGPRDTTQTYVVWGGDARFETGGFLVAVEAMGGDNYADVISAPVADVPRFLGAYVETIYRAPGGWEPGFRVERFDPDTGTGDDAEILVTGQIARSFNSNFRWQINLIHTEYEADGAEARDELVSQWTVKL